MNTKEVDYLLERAEEELKSAQHATHPEVVKVHYTMAGHYLDRVYGPGEHEPNRFNSRIPESSEHGNIED